MVTGRKLLLADDSVTIQKVIDLTFSDEGIEVTTVGNGEQALSKLEELQPDIVLADIFMPGRNGYEVCEHIKRDERFRHIPVMLLVGSFEPFDEAEARRVGADDYLTKPFQSIRQLVNKVTSLISGGTSSEDETSTRDLELPEELARKERDSGRDAGADIYTADTAPLPKELADKDPAEAAAHLAGHESLDDEMIEASRPGEGAEPLDGDAAASESRPTAPLSFADLKEAGIKSSAPAEPKQLQETVRDLKLDEMNDDILSAELPERNYMSNAAAADEALLDLGEIDAPVATTEADDFILDLQDDLPAAPVPQAAEPAAAAPSWSEAERPAMETAGAPSASYSAQPEASAYSQPLQAEGQSYPLQESAPMGAASHASEEMAAPASFVGGGLDVLESSEERASEAFESRESLAPEATEQEPSAASSDIVPAIEAETSEAAEASAAPRAGQITLEQLSPEAIDAIARRAVELLSTKVVEDIAWEVVPQLAELLIKRKLEEEKT